MAKRIADDQITREKFNEDGSGDEGAPKIEKASAEVMAKRKILQPKGRRINNGEPAGQNKFNFGASGGSGSLFKGFGAAQENKNGEHPANIFSGGNSVVSANQFGQPTNTTTTAKATDDKNQKLRALNEKFVESVKNSIEPNVVADLTPIAQKYIDYYKGIQNAKVDDSVTSSQKDIEPTLTKAQESESSSDSEDEIKVEGPKFVMDKKPAKSTLPFSFNKKPSPKEADDSDSDSEVEIKGPAFTFSKEVKENVFKVDSLKSSSFNFAFGSNNVENNNSSNGTSSKGDNEKEGKETSQKSQALPSKPFSFGSTNGNSEINFFSKPSTNNGDADKNSNKDSNLEASSKPTFTFGSNPLPQDKPNPFSAVKSQDSKPLFESSEKDSKTESTDDKSASKPLFQFNTDVSKPAGAIGGSGNSTQSQSNFSFNTKTSEKENDKPSSKPAFTFGSSAPAFGNDSKPAFSFTPQPSSDKKDTAPAFSFGSSSSFTNIKSGSLFSAGKTDDNKEKETSKPLFQFSFKKTENNNGSDSQSQSSGVFGAAKPDTPEETEAVAEEETGGNFEPVVKLSDKVDAPKTGEEDEELLYTKRSKLMLFDPSKSEEPYTNRGVGDLKVLKSKKDNKSRILIRSDGSLRVLFNNLISKDLTYSKLGNGSMVRVPTVDPTTKEIQTYVIKVKTPQDGQDLLDVINQAKDS